MRRGQGRPGASMAADLAAIRAVLREDDGGALAEELRGMNQEVEHWMRVSMGVSRLCAKLREREGATLDDDD
jgi:hypothetical protein